MQAHCLNSLVSFWRALCARKFIHQSGPCTISVKTLPLCHVLVCGRPCCSCWFLLPGILQGMSLLLSRHGHSDKCNNHVLDFCTSHSQVLLCLLNCECWVSCTYLRICFMYIILTFNCIDWEFDYCMLKLNMLLWWCYFLGFVHVSF